MVTTEKINDCNICYLLDPPIHIREYYKYCTKLLKNALKRNDKPLNVILGPLNHPFYPPVIKIDIQCEHTLVKEGGRSVEKKYFGRIKTNEGGYYLVRIDKYDYLNTLDFIIEYSQPNLLNMKESGYFESYINKNIYIAPLIYEQDFNKEFKKNTITLFNSGDNDRRSNFTHKMALNRADCTNINNCFTEESLLHLYKATKIMINVHQTDHHHTFEELRVLPALCNGVIIISESVPLKETIPYNEFIVWSDYSNLVETIVNVQNNYEEYYNKIFNDNLRSLLKTMESQNNNNIFEKIIRQ
jgi:hypothetical protein